MGVIDISAYRPHLLARRNQGRCARFASHLPLAILFRAFGAAIQGITSRRHDGCELAGEDETQCAQQTRVVTERRGEYRR